MKSCSTWNCGKILWVLRILLGLGMLYMGIMKFTMLPGVLDMLGGSAHALWFDFLSVNVWGWIAIVGEILAGLLLLVGCKGAKKWAFLTAIIMIFALNMTGWADWKAWLFFVVAMIILIRGGGKRSVCGKSCSCKSGCTGGSCDTKEVVEA